MILNEELANKKPMVSISMLTYNHEKYIEQAIKSVLMQEVDFDYQLIIGEDCSTDNTRNIVIKYAQAYPDKIIAILNDKNVGMKENSINVRRYLNGKYITALEGDDFWTDKKKLAKQVVFLEKNLQYSAVAHKHYEVNENGNKITGEKLREYSTGYSKTNIYTIKEVEKYYLAAHTATILYKNFYKTLSRKQIYYYNNNDIVGDRKLNLVLAYLGGIYKFNEYMSAYRHHSKSWTEKARVGGLAFYGYQIIPKLNSLAYDMFGIKLNFREGRMRCWYGTCIELLKNCNSDNYHAVKMIFNDGNKLKKIIYLFTHTLSYPVRILLRSINYER